MSASSGALFVAWTAPRCGVGGCARQEPGGDKMFKASIISIIVLQ